MVSVQQKDLLEEDLKVVYTELLEEAGLSLAEEQKNFYDYLHFSPIKVNVSRSLRWFPTICERILLI